MRNRSKDTPTREVPRLNTQRANDPGTSYLQKSAADDRGQKITGEEPLLRRCEAPQGIGDMFGFRHEKKAGAGCKFQERGNRSLLGTTLKVWLVCMLLRSGN